MKKLIVSILATFLLVSFTACKNDSSKDSSKSQGSKSESSSEVQTAKYADYIDPSQSEGKDIMTLIGHASVKIKTKQGTVIYIDPYFDGDYSESADIVLVTHEHSDHNAISKVQLKENGRIIRRADVLKDGVYSNMEIAGVKIEAVAAYNNNHIENSCVGYILDFNGIKLYHAGDTSKTDEMNSFAEKKITYALLPVDGVYNMGPEEATEVANLIKAKHSIPIHTNINNYPYNEETALAFNPESRLLVEYGNSIELVP